MNLSRSSRLHSFDGSEGTSEGIAIEDSRLLRPADPQHTATEHCAVRMRRGRTLMLFASALRNRWLSVSRSLADAQAPDDNRLNAIREAYRDAVANLDREIAALDRKYRRFADMASLYLGNVEACLEPREAADEHQLRSAEEMMIATSDRLRELKLQRDIMVGLRAQFEAATGRIGETSPE